VLKENIVNVNVQRQLNKQQAQKKALKLWQNAEWPKAVRSAKVWFGESFPVVIVLSAKDRLEDEGAGSIFYKVANVLREGANATCRVLGLPSISVVPFNDKKEYIKLHRKDAILIYEKKKILD
jgi:hypothetical protein